MKILALDPGKSTGWSNITVGDDKKIVAGRFGVTKDMTLVEIKDEIEAADVIVYEGWRTRPENARRGDFDYQSIWAEQVIGSLRTLCNLFGKDEVVEQQPAIKPVGYGFANLKYVPGKKGTHWQDAFAHGVYYAVKMLRANPVR